MPSITKASLKKYVISLISPWVVQPVWIALGLTSLAVGLVHPQGVNAKPTVSAAEAQFNQMFSPEIHTLMGACEQRGGVNLAAGADRDGSVICGDGWRKSPVKYADYFDTTTDFLGAALLIGVRSGLQANSTVKPEVLNQLLGTPEWIQFMRDQVDQMIVQSHAVAKNSPKSIKLLSDRIMARILPILRDPAKLSNLMGTSEEYSKIAQNFCPSSGVSLKQAKSLTPNLNGVQIYAICLQESGLADEVTRELRRATSR